ncbi:MAG: PilZ domain-containing protein [Candidatus Omnitrophica bacterium]|nr:PilZ domain-containing protein [Candidatus Omnitrophota bacterium]
MINTIGEQRRYIRISTVLPVEFYFLGVANKRLSPYLQGFTNNIGKGGICLIVNDLWWGFADRLVIGSKLGVNINIFLGKAPIFAIGRIVWKEAIRYTNYYQYRCGLEFELIEDKKRAILFSYGLFKKFTPYLVTAILLSLGLTTGFSFWKNTQVSLKNKQIIRDYNNILIELNNLKDTLKRERENISMLIEEQKERQQRIEELEKELYDWQMKYGSLEKTKGNQDVVKNMEKTIVRLKNYISTLKRENDFLKIRIDERGRISDTILDRLKMQEKITYWESKKVIEGMCDWIRNKQDKRSGLVLSYEGDKELERLAFTYDQALAVITFLIFDEPQRAKKILDFYLNELNNNRPIYNAYYTNGKVSEYIIHSGVNAWLGIASLNYIFKTKDTSYLFIAERVAEFLEKMMDEEGGIRGGPDIYWYSTEHNLDSFAFFRLLGLFTGKKHYYQLSDKISYWITRYVYTHRDVPVLRGKGDATIATDTYAWSITAFGPEELLRLDMEPDEIVRFAINNCEVETTFPRQGQLLRVRGFDFAKFRNLPRGGVISCEWTAQMILAFQIMASYYKDKDILKYEDYLNKVIFYSNELQKMIIPSPSPAGKSNPVLPYASLPFADTGHGWRTPKANMVGSLSATAYFLIAYRGYNPLRGEFLDVSLEGIYEKGRK